MSAAEPETVALPPLTGALDALWELILDLAERAPERRWLLVGGQMVMLHGLRAGLDAMRASQDVDVLADLVTDADALTRCARALRDLGLMPQRDSGGRVYRFVREQDGVRADLLAPDRYPPRRLLRTTGGDTIPVPAGTQALQRLMPLRVVKDGRSAIVPVPDLLGALVLKAAAWAADSRDRERHSADAAFLTSLIADPIGARDRFKGSDRSRLLRLGHVLNDPDAREWHSLGARSVDAHVTWQLLLS